MTMSMNQAIATVKSYNRNQIKKLDEQFNYFFGLVISDKRKRKSEITHFIIMNWDKRSEICMAIYNAE